MFESIWNNDPAKFSGDTAIDIPKENINTLNDALKESGTVQIEAIKQNELDSWLQQLEDKQTNQPDINKKPIPAKIVTEQPQPKHTPEHITVTGKGDGDHNETLNEV